MNLTSTLQLGLAWHQTNILVLKVFANIIKLENRTFGLIAIEDENQNVR
jgi:hypothetical protein